MSPSTPSAPQGIALGFRTFLGAALLCLVLPAAVGAVVIRHDRDDADYLAQAADYPALADFAGSGHGLLIAPQWVVTAAHVVPHCLESVDIGGQARRVERVVMHPGYTPPSDALIAQVVASGDPTALWALLHGSDDIALVRLAEPVQGIVPLALHRGDDEAGQIIRIAGKGATSNGRDGLSLDAAQRGLLRTAQNRVTGAHGRWLWYQFDAPPAGLPLEGVMGSGDSGGPVLIEQDGQPRLAGLASWTRAAPGLSGSLRSGLYGQVLYAVRISHHAGWIDEVTAGDAAGP